MAVLALNQMEIEGVVSVAGRADAARDQIRCCHMRWTLRKCDQASV
jgi:hypothetical protein